jgi:hypothetical protein
MNMSVSVMLAIKTDSGQSQRNVPTTKEFRSSQASMIIRKSELTLRLRVDNAVRRGVGKLRCGCAQSSLVLK